MPSLELCPICKEYFYVPYSDWGYAYNGQRCCSYKCMRAMSRKDPETHNVKSQLQGTLPVKYQPEKEITMSTKRMTPEALARIRELYAQDTPIKAISAETGYSGHTISLYLKRDKAAEDPAAQEVAPGCFIQPAAEEPAGIDKAAVLAAIVQALQAQCRTLDALTKVLAGEQMTS